MTYKGFSMFHCLDAVLIILMVKDYKVLDLNIFINNYITCTQLSRSSIDYYLSHIQEAGSESKGASHLRLLHSRHHAVSAVDCWLITLAPPYKRHAQGLVLCCISNYRGEFRWLSHYVL